MTPRRPWCTLRRGRALTVTCPLFTHIAIDHLLYYRSLTDGPEKLSQTYPSWLGIQSKLNSRLSQGELTSERIRNSHDPVRSVWNQTELVNEHAALTGFTHSCQPEASSKLSADSSRIQLVLSTVCGDLDCGSIRTGLICHSLALAFGSPILNRSCRPS